MEQKRFLKLKLSLFLLSLRLLPSLQDKGDLLVLTITQVVFLKDHRVYHWKYPMSSSISMYLLCTVFCQHIHRSRIRHWVLIGTLWWGLIILILTLGFDLSVLLCWKPYIKVEFNVGYFQWYVSIRFSNRAILMKYRWSWQHSRWSQFVSSAGNIWPLMLDSKLCCLLMWQWLI